MVNSLIKPKNISIIDIDGKSREFILHRVPPLIGRRIALQIVQSLLPKKFGGQYSLSEELSSLLLSYVSIKIGSLEDVPLDSELLIDNHVGDFQTLLKLEYAMIKYNTHFDLDANPLVKSAMEALGIVSSDGDLDLDGK